MKTQRGVLEDDYELGEKLGSGFYGNVYRGKCLRTGMTVAIKVLPRTGDREADATVRREVAAMRCFVNDTAITEIHEFYESSEHFYIVMEFVDGGELLDLLVDGGPFREPRAAALIKEVGGAIALLHAQGMCHSDIKPENIVLTKEGQVRLIDFGTTFAVDAKLDQVPRRRDLALTRARARSVTLTLTGPGAQRRHRAVLCAGDDREPHHGAPL